MKFLFLSFLYLSSVSLGERKTASSSSSWLIPLIVAGSILFLSCCVCFVWRRKRSDSRTIETDKEIHKVRLSAIAKAQRHLARSDWLSASESPILVEP